MNFKTLFPRALAVILGCISDAVFAQIQVPPISVGVLTSAVGAAISERRVLALIFGLLSMVLCIVSWLVRLAGTTDEGSRERRLYLLGACLIALVSMIFLTIRLL